MTTFLKQTENGRFMKVQDISQADFVRIPTDEYVPVDEWNSLIEQHMMLKKQFNEIWNAPKSDDDCYKIPISEYHGLQNCLRIIKDRSLQEIDKEKADQRGYTLKYAEQRIYDRSHPKQKAYLISKTTPVSLKIDLETASFLIRKDLASFYNYVDLSNIRTCKYRSPFKIKAIDLLLAISQRDDPEYTHDFYCDNSDNGRQIKDFLDKAPTNLIFNIARINANQGQGVYEVSYWATGLI